MYTLRKVVFTDEKPKSPREMYMLHVEKSTSHEWENKYATSEYVHVFIYTLRKVIDTFLRFQCTYNALFYLFKVSRTDGSHGSL